MTAPSSAREARKILLVAPVPSHPGTTGASTRIRHLAETLCGLGHDVHFLHLQQPLRSDDGGMRAFWGDRLHVFRGLSPRSIVARARRKAIRLVAKTLHANVPVDSYVDPAGATFVRALFERLEFDTVILSYVFYSQLFEAMPGTPKRILDTHDTFSDRYQLYRKHGQPAEFFSTSRAEERKALERADVVLAIQSGDATHFRTLTDRPVAVVGHLAAPVPSPAAPPADARLLFVGGPMAINVHAVRWFVREVLPRIRRERPDAELWLAGGVGTRIPPEPGVRRLGFVERLADEYRRAAVVVNPQQFGTGLSIKGVEALAHGRPLVTTESGARGLEDGAGTAFLLARSAEEFARVVLSVLQDRERAAALARNAGAYAREYHRRNVQALQDVVTRPRPA